MVCFKRQERVDQTHKGSSFPFVTVVDPNKFFVFGEEEQRQIVVSLFAVIAFGSSINRKKSS
jgi:hypothetical protein